MTRATRYSFGLAAALIVAGHVWDGVWHSRRGGDESGTAMLEAHFLIYVGIVAAALAALAAIQRHGREATFVVAVAAAAVALAGHAVDAYGHSRGGDVVAAHLAYMAGEVVLLVVAALVVRARTTID